MKQVLANIGRVPDRWHFCCCYDFIGLEISVPQISSSYDAVDSAAARTELLNELFDFGQNYLVLRLVLYY